MQRRTFLLNTSKLGLSTVASSMLLGCGGGGTDALLDAAGDVVSEINNKIIEINTKQSSIDATYKQLQENLNFSSSLLNFYDNTVPQYAVDSLFNENYLQRLNSEKTLWENAQSAHQIAYEQYKHQAEKMKAAFKVFDHKQTETDSTAKQSKTISLASRKETITAQDDALAQLLAFIESLASQTLTGTILGFVESFLENIATTLNEYLQNDANAALDYALSVYLVIEALLELIREKTLSEIDLGTNNETLTGLSKVTVASISVLQIASKQTLKIAQDDLTDDEAGMLEFLTSNSLDSKISSVWMGISSKIALDTIEQLKNSAAKSIEDQSITEQENLATSLKSKSQILALTSATIKYLFGKTSELSIQQTESSFTPDSTASDFKILFGADKNPYDEALSQAMYESKTTFDDAEPTLSSTPNKSFKVSVTDAARKATTEAEAEAYVFSAQLASTAYTVTADTQTDAVDFTTHLADLAYQFVMDIEEDAYQFAMQGMEYGYLFASRGEEVGIMADRILWMAVQIGAMADRIGEMADRIVYTEQLIVYTEILILDFGILIYGFGEFITNTMLTGLALIFDREWYVPTSNDYLLETINSNAMSMLDNMHEYSLAVLEHQNDLRNLTLDALDSLPFTTPESNTSNG